MNNYLILNARIVNQGTINRGFVLVRGGIIRAVAPGEPEVDSDQAEVINAGGKCLIPGVIDDHVHFREPGLTHKAEIATESRAAVAGGVTSYMEMPNTNPRPLPLRNWKRNMTVQLKPPWPIIHFTWEPPMTISGRSGNWIRHPIAG